jgi:hypothetical protein
MVDNVEYRGGTTRRVILLAMDHVWIANAIAIEIQTTCNAEKITAKKLWSREPETIASLNSRMWYICSHFMY